MWMFLVFGTFRVFSYLFTLSFFIFFLRENFVSLFFRFGEGYKNGRRGRERENIIDMEEKGKGFLF